MQDIIERAQRIRLLLLDVDGILSNGTLIYGLEGAELKKFNVYDGLGIKLLQKNNIAVGIISARLSSAVTQRMHDLQVIHVYQNCDHKLSAYEDVKQKLKLADNEIAYMGDDLPDLPVLRQVGLAISVPNASSHVQQHVHWITSAKGGKGAVREVCELILDSQQLLEKTVQTYL